MNLLSYNFFLMIPVSPLLVGLDNILLFVRYFGLCRISQSLGATIWKQIFLAPTDTVELNGESLVKRCITPKKTLDLQKQTVVSSLDLFNSKLARNFSFLFDYELNIDMLCESLSELLEKYPQIGGQLQKKGKEIIIEHAKPKVEVLEQNFSENELKTLLELTDSSEILNWFQNTEWTNEKWKNFAVFLPVNYPISLHVPLTLIKINYLHINQKIYSFISISFNHVLNDAGSAINFIKEWSELNANKISLHEIQPNHNRKIIRETFKKNDFLHIQNHKQLGIRNVFFLKSFFISGFNLFLNRNKKFQFYKLHVSQSFIQSIKNELQNHPDVPDKFSNRISTNDIISALIWKYRLKYESYHWYFNYFFTRRNLIILYSIKSKFSPLGKNFFGNSALFANLTSSVSQLHDLSFVQLIVAIRHLISNFSDEKISATLSFLNNQFNPEPSFDCGCDIRIPIDMMVSNWAQFPLFDINFGNGNPCSFVYAIPGFSVPGSVFIIPSKQEGFDIALVSSEEFANQWRKLNSLDSTQIRELINSK